MSISSDEMRLSALLSSALSQQVDDLLVARWRLEQAMRLVPTVDETQWQGPARSAYDWRLGVLRRTLEEAHGELSEARRLTQTAVRALPQ